MHSFLICRADSVPMAGVRDFLSGFCSTVSTIAMLLFIAIFLILTALLLYPGYVKARGRGEFSGSYSEWLDHILFGD